MRTMRACDNYEHYKPWLSVYSKHGKWVLCFVAYVIYYLHKWIVAWKRTRPIHCMVTYGGIGYEKEKDA